MQYLPGNCEFQQIRGDAKFKGLCAYCGIYGHSGAECKERMTNNGEKSKIGGSKDNNFFPGLCWKCNKKGHKSMHCKLKSQGNEGNTDSVNLSRASEIALIGSKDDEKGHCMFLGSESNHPHDTIRVLDLKKKSVMLPRNIRWIDRTYGKLFWYKSRKLFWYKSPNWLITPILTALMKTWVEQEEKGRHKPFSMITQNKALMDDVEDKESDMEYTEERGRSLEDDKRDS